MRNPLMDQAAADRHEPKYGYHCKSCGSTASTYNCNAALIDQRPEAISWDWWIACDNAGCVNAVGEGFFQWKPEWVERRQ